MLPFISWSRRGGLCPTLRTFAAQVSILRYVRWDAAEAGGGPAAASACMLSAVYLSVPYLVTTTLVIFDCRLSNVECTK